MSVVRNGDLYIATRITGPTANVLGLDFSTGREPYVRDFSEPEAPSPAIDSIRRQVVEVLRAAGVDEADLVGIQFDSQDSPSESVYGELTRQILESRRSHEHADSSDRMWPTKTES